MRKDRYYRPRQGNRPVKYWTGVPVSYTHLLVNQVEYAYMLKGLEDAWYTVTDPNSVTFRNVPPGDYHFMVKTRIKNQEWSDEVTTLDIHIVPPLWLTWWAKCSYVSVSYTHLFCF